MRLKVPFKKQLHATYSDIAHRLQYSSNSYEMDSQPILACDKWTQSKQNEKDATYDMLTEV